MKKILIALVLLCAATAAFAGSSADVTSTVNSTTAANAGATNAGNAQNINFINPGNTDSTIRSAPTVYAPNPITPYTSASCIYAPSMAASFIGFGIGGSAPIDGETCNWRLSIQGVQATAAGLRDLAIASVKSVPAVCGLKAPVAPEDIISDMKKPDSAPDPETLLRSSSLLMIAATDMQCLNSDRQRAVMERLGFCHTVSDIATLDHRFNQPRSLQVDYK